MEEIETKVSDVKAQLGFLVHQVVCMLGEQHGFLDSPSLHLYLAPSSSAPSWLPSPSRCFPPAVLVSPGTGPATYTPFSVCDAQHTPVDSQGAVLCSWSEH